MIIANEIIEADLTLIDGRFQRGVQVGVDSAGRIRELGALARPPTKRLTRRALLPGFVNVHSHAFQRALRGIGETFPPGVNDFWTWREEMYALVQRLDRDEFLRIARLAFKEMLAAGITTVGEFHYLHHPTADAPDFAFDELVVQAAAETGIRLVLLLCYYKTGGVGRPLVGGQRHFSTQSVAEFFAHADRLRARLDSRSQSMGIAPHSLRAVPPEDFAALARGASERGLVLHMHVEEQRREIDEVRAALGVTPLGWILDNIDAGPHCTIIHGTHSDAREMDRYIAAGGNVCICPISEANLGDGVADLPRMLARPDAVCIGSDSNIRIDLCEEVRWLEYVQRLRNERRGVCKDASGGVAPLLHACGTRNGARALNLATGEIAIGRAADFVCIDLDHISLAGWSDESLLDTFVFGSGREAIGAVCIGGRWRG